MTLEYSIHAAECESRDVLVGGCVQEGGLEKRKVKISLNGLLLFGQKVSSVSS